MRDANENLVGRDPCDNDDNQLEEEMIEKHPIGTIAKFWGNYLFCEESNRFLVLTFVEKYAHVHDIPVESMVLINTASS